MRTRVSLLSGLALAALLGGCQAAQPTGAEPTDMVPPPTDSNAALMEYVGDQPFVTADAGYRAAYVLWSGEVSADDFAALRARLVEAGLADRVWSHGPQSRLTRADVGYLVCRAAGVRTGVNWNLLGLGRYAYRELQYHGIAGPGGDLGLVSGGEFQGILRKAEDYRARQAREGEAVELGARPQ
jgi:hypothetical protein